jgi:hypothetical protein
MRTLLRTVGFALAMAGSSAASAQDFALSASDRAAVDALIDPVLAAFEGPSSREAVSAFLATGRTGLATSPQVGVITGQIETALNAYGRVERCVLTDEAQKGGLAVQHSYLCQHPKFLTRWKFVVIKLPDGWTAGSIYFDDKIDELFTEEPQAR